MGGGQLDYIPLCLAHGGASITTHDNPDTSYVISWVDTSTVMEGQVLEGGPQYYHEAHGIKVSRAGQCR